MELRDVAKLLENLGFKGLNLVETNVKFSTFKFQSEDSRKLRNLERTVTSDGTVEVYQLPEIGKFGVSKANSMVRFFSFVGDTKVKTDDSHLGHVKVTPELSLGFEKAKVNSAYRVPFCKKLWAFLNTEKFHGAMRAPKLEVSHVPSFGFGRGIKGARGVYMAGREYTPGIIWMADFMFNAREPFFLEVFLHEMCHQAVWVLDHYHAPMPDKDQGHGHNWKAWMTKVGLDPRRYDPTDDAEYSDTTTSLAKEEELLKKYGKRADPAEFKGLVPVPDHFTPGANVILKYKGRALAGVIRKGTRTQIEFTFRTPKGELNTLGWRAMPANSFFYPKGHK